MKYKKNDLKDIIAKGSLKQRLVLWFNHAHSADTLLTKEEEKALYNSFSTNEEARAFNEWESKRRAFGKVIDFLDTTRRTYRFHMARLTGFTILLNSYNEVESILNDVLFILGDDAKRSEVVEHLISKRLSLAKIEKSKDEGFIIVDTKGDTNLELGNERGDTDIKVGTLLEDILYVEKVHATRTLSSFKGALKAIKEISKKEGFRSKFHNDLLKEYEEEAQEYQGSFTGYNPLFLEEIPSANPKVKEALKKFDLFPNYEEVEADDKIYELTLEQYRRLSG